jgi:methylenetetrahydrofolate dehydrogenase (NADP+)/methenyltetrahydrofolate cyclohydrolase
MILINGKEISEKITSSLSHEIDILAQRNIIPAITIIQIGDNQASNVYVRNKLRLCEKLHVVGKIIKLPESTTEDELTNLIIQLNNDNSINGILLQLPIPKHINENEIINLIKPEKDVDCFCLVNVGAL